LLALLTELMESTRATGQLRPEINPTRMAAMTMRTVMCVAQSSGESDDGVAGQPITADEIWDFCSHGFAAD